MYFYGTEAGADAYITTAAWLALTSAEKQLNMYMAALWLDAKLWKGRPTDKSQTAAWPRAYVQNRNGAYIDSATVPDDIVTASYELARLNSEGKTLFASSVSQDFTNGAGALVKSTVTAGKGGGVEVTKEYDQGGSSVVTDRVAHEYPLVDALIDQYLVSGGSTNKLVRF